MLPDEMMPFPENVRERAFANEAEVEVHLVAPLLEYLGYSSEDIAPKFPVTFQEGRRGRPHEADFAIFAGPAHSKDTSLLVIEAKGPGEKLYGGLQQAESYAANLRTAFYFVTNGSEFELWQLQLTAASNRVLAGSIKVLAEKLGEITLYISKPAAIKYANTLRQKHLDKISTDLTTYYHNELTRTASHRSTIARLLYPFGSGTEGALSSNVVFERMPQGAVIVGPSGFGKSTLAVAMLRQAVVAASSAPRMTPVVYLVFPEIHAAEKSILQYAAERLAAHCPQINLSSLQHILRRDGGIFLCDGYDRLCHTARGAVLAELQELTRDYPRVALFVFSRTSSMPVLELPSLELREYSDEEQSECLQLITSDTAGLPSLTVGMLPDTLKSVLKMPLLLKLAAMYWLEHKSLPTDLDILFRSWLDCLLQKHLATASQTILRERALRLFASVSIGGSFSSTKLLSKFIDGGIPADIFDDLVRSDALRHTGATVELPHETLGEYLRAVQIAESDDAELDKHLREFQVDRETMFPVLLMNQLKRRRHQRILLERLAATDLPTYFDAIRHRRDVSEEITSGTPEDFSRAYLEDLLDGIEQPLNAFFPVVQRRVAAILSGSTSSSLAIVGRGSPQWINYAIVPSDDSSRVTVGPFSEYMRICGTALPRVGLRADSGRILGARELARAVLEANEERLLTGGLAWRSERVIGRIRALQEIGSGVDVHQPIEVLIAYLRPHAGEMVATRLLDPHTFLIDAVLDDLTALQSRGDDYLDLWWERFGTASSALFENEGNTRKLLDELYRRVQITYREIVESSFSRLSASFGFYTSLPVRWNVAVRAPTDPSRFPTLHFGWAPVENWDQAGADVEFCSDVPSQMRTWNFSAVRDRLQQLGRLTQNTHLWCGSTVPMRFDGRSLLGGFTGETPVVEEACRYIKNELEAIFRPCPGADMPYSFSHDFG